MNGSNKIKWIRRLGSVLVVIGLAFVVRRIHHMHVDFSMLLRPRIFGSLIAGTVLCLVANLLLAMAWCLALRTASDAEFPLRDGVAVYLKANIGKYLPGNVFHYVERNIFVRDIGMGQAETAASSLLEIMGQLAGAMFLSVVFLRRRASVVTSYLEGMASPALWIIIPVMIILITCMAILTIRKTPIGGIASRLMERTKIPAYFKMLGIYVLNLVTVSFSMLLLVIAISGGRVGTDDVNLIMGSYVLGWMLGFVVPGAPGGIGIREMVITLLMNESPLFDAVVLAAVIQRLASILGDVGGYLISLFLMKPMGGKSVKADQNEA